MNRFVTSAALAMMMASAAFAQDAVATDATAADQASPVAPEATAPDAAAPAAAPTADTTAADAAAPAAAPAADTTAAASSDSAALTDTAVASNDGIRNFNAEDVPTFAIAADGTVDWPTFSGFRRYHAECHVCHGPDGEGSSYAPALKNSVMRIDYYDFVGVVAGGKQEVGQAQNQVMPSFGANPNVMCYLDDIYTYLRARGTEAVPRGRPAKKEAKSDAYDAAEASCMGF